ncbi:MAG: LPXTG cell wall anchor domain-containing protein [Candidatus Daviesbacteria bacterium]|nr:LPXTG cell wall anchor domain-containing protein [Candidatus Daviesbacteria bacterium]
MDNNNSTPAVPTPASAPAQQPAAEKTGGNKMVLWFIIGLVIVIALVGGIYFFLSKQQNATEPEAVTQIPATAPQENLENDLNSINVDTATTSSDFNAVDQDLQSL